MKKTMVITGASGLLGQYLTSYFSKKLHVKALYFSKSPTNLLKENNIEYLPLDLTEPLSVKAFLKSSDPDFIIHTAGLTSVDLCESDPKLAEILNVQATLNISTNINPLKTKLIHISTDHLFSGMESFKTENDTPFPINEYARTKLLAEQFALKYENSLILRTNFYGGATLQKKSFSNWLYQELISGNKVEAFDNSFFTPISIPCLAENLEKLMESKLYGIYNVVGSQRLSKFEFAKELAQFFDMNSSLIIKSNIENAHLKAPRPHDMSLSNEKIKKDLPEFQNENIIEGLKKIRSHQLI